MHGLAVCGADISCNQLLGVVLDPAGSVHTSEAHSAAACICGAAARPVQLCTGAAAGETTCRGHTYLLLMGRESALFSAPDELYQT